MSIEQVINTLFEAMLLVFAVMFLFLQNLRYTLIPTLVVPVALMGTFAVMLAMGFSVNVLTLFGMVLAIGILVDDAIVVVENVERIMAEEGLPPKEATRKAMGQISGAIIGITLVLVAVFLPMAFMQGSVGVIYQQFSLSMAVSILFSAFLALSLTPALCATLLKPVAKGEHHARKGFFGWFNRRFESMSNGYQRWVVLALKRSGRYLVVYAVLLAVLGYGFSQLPTAFLPTEDQGHNHYRHPTAARCQPHAHRTGSRADRGAQRRGTRGGQHHLDSRFQLLRQRAERGAGLHHAQGLVRARHR